MKLVEFKRTNDRSEIPWDISPPLHERAHHPRPLATPVPGTFMTFMTFTTSPQTPPFPSTPGASSFVPR